MEGVAEAGPSAAPQQILEQQQQLRRAPALQRANSPPTPAPSPGPNRALNHAHAESRSQTPPLSAEDTSLAQPGDVLASFNSQALVKQVLSQFALMNPNARLELISSLIGDCNVHELAHVSRLISPRLRIDFLSELPIEVSLHILSFVDDPKTLARAASVSRFWRSLVNDEQTWMAMCVKHRYQTRKQAGVSASSAAGFGSSSRRRPSQMGMADLRSEAEEANILPSLYQRYRARGLDPSNAMQELQTLHALFLAKQEGHSAAVPEQLSAQDRAFYAQLEEIVAEEIQDRYGKTQADLRTPLHRRVTNTHTSEQEQRAGPSNVGRLSAAPIPGHGSSAYLYNSLSPTQHRASLSDAASAFGVTLPSSSHSVASAGGPVPSTSHQDAMDTDSQEVMATPQPQQGQSPSWWGEAAAAAVAAVSQAPILSSAFASTSHQQQQLQQPVTTPHAQSFVPSLSAISPSAAASMAANFLRTPNLRTNAVAGLGNAFTNSLNALGLERAPLTKFTSPFSSEPEADPNQPPGSPTPIGCFDGNAMSYSTAGIENPSSGFSPFIAQSFNQVLNTVSLNKGKGKERSERRHSATGLGHPSQQDPSKARDADRAVSHSGVRDYSQPFSYKEHFKLAYQTESSWLRGGRLLSQHTGADERMLVTSLAVDSDWIIFGTSTHKIYVFDARTGLYINTFNGHTDGVWCLSIIKGRRRTQRSQSQQETMVVTHPDNNGGRPHIAVGRGDLKLVHHDARPSAGEGLDSDDTAIHGLGGISDDDTLAWFHKTRRAMLKRQQDPDAMADEEEIGLPDFDASNLGGLFNHSDGGASGLNNPTGSVRGYGNATSLLVSAGSDRDIRVWNLATGECLKVLKGHVATVRCLRVYDGRPIAVSGSRDSTLRMWNIETGELIHVLRGHQRSVRCLDIAGDIIASGSYDATCRVWDANTGECLQLLTGHAFQIYAVVTDGERVATGSLDSTVRIWNARSGECLALFQGHTSLVGQLQLSEKVLVTGGSDGRVIVFSLSTFQCLHRLCAHDNSVTCLQFDDRFIVTGGNDGHVKLWDFNTGQFIRELGQPSERVDKIAFRDDKCVIVCLRDGKPSIEVISFRPVEEQRA